MNVLSEISRYMGHRGGIDKTLEDLIFSCLEKLNEVSSPRHAISQFSCVSSGDTVKIDSFTIKSSCLAANLDGCNQVYLLAATLGADVDRLIAQRSKIDSAEALCLQACAAEKIEHYCNDIESELNGEINPGGFYLRPRFSPGYSDFDISFQTELLFILQAEKRIGLSETQSHMLSPLKSVTALIGAASRSSGGAQAARVENKCVNCSKDCQFRRNHD
jgi:hypothetical protein